MANEDSELSPLDQIRLVESEMARRITAARVAVDQAMSHARNQAAQLKTAAHETGLREGQILYKESVTRAEEEARSIYAESQRKSTELRLKGQQRIEAAVERAVDVVLGWQVEAGAK